MEVNCPGAGLARMNDRIGFGGAARAAYAADPWASRGRLFSASASATRTEFQRDRDRIVHSTAFRRLGEKTQVFLADEGDHYRTRLTHTLEVAQIARALARALRLDEDLAEALALAHDLGHSPFGHAGERALDRAMAGNGGFDHNAQSLRVVMRLERRYPDFDGLNLTGETLEGLIKHNGPLIDSAGAPVARYAKRGIPAVIVDSAAALAVPLDTYASGEAQAAAIADDIAYDTHDIDDGLRAGLLTLDGLRTVPLPGRILAEIESEHPGLAEERVAHELVRRLITRMIEDVIGESVSRLDRLAPGSCDAIRQAKSPVVDFSDGMRADDEAIKAYLKGAVYSHPRVRSVMDDAERMVEVLFAHYVAHPSAMPENWRPTPDMDSMSAARRVADFLAGMTDRYATAAYRDLVS